jgi:hypothetical protein
MENNKKDSFFNWLRFTTTFVIIILAVASLLVVGATAYKIGHEHGYNQLEKEIVYAIALSKSKRVGKFLVAKLDNGGTIIALNEIPFLTEMEE